MCRRKGYVSLFLDLTGVILTAGLIAICVAFATPYWYRSHPSYVGSYVTQFQLPFDSLGLWMLCYRTYPVRPDPYWRYQVTCRTFVLSFKSDIRLPAFFVATQVLYTIGLILAAVAFLLHLFILGCFFTVNRAVLAVLFTISFLAALSISIALIIFGGRIDDLGYDNRNRDWIFGARHQDFFWSYWLAIAGGILLWIATFFYVFEFFRYPSTEESKKVVKATEVPANIITTVYYPSGPNFIPYTSV
ncbi:hypothetical protein RvY_01099 [Ramazzottius varieornatus]|uniref:Uncharacterized protein n=1 Tax=Ramazzottius varieornatus TaxID=947166 RepID=A0A1D1UIP9_RAMVA|nr:hypothetical protein RvY_01099 [Ramazzottius varieornatus]